jgi:hypothetical protein
MKDRPLYKSTYGTTAENVFLGASEDKQKDCLFSNIAKQHESVKGNMAVARILRWYC